MRYSRRRPAPKPVTSERADIEAAKASGDAALMAAVATYYGSDGNATKTLYDALCKRGARGLVLMNLFRAHKCSARAKVYRGGNSEGRYKDLAYGRKAYSLAQLDEALIEHGEKYGIAWGWRKDNAQTVHNWILYVETPEGQVSFHTDTRGNGPEYPGEWDGVRGVGAMRICKSIAAFINEASQ